MERMTVCGVTLVPEGMAPPEPEFAVHEHAPVALALHRGPYDELGLAYHEVERWVKDHARRTSGPLFDIYLNDPAETDPADLETQICWPIA